MSRNFLHSRNRKSAGREICILLALLCMFLFMGLNPVSLTSVSAEEEDIAFEISIRTYAKGDFDQAQVVETIGVSMQRLAAFVGEDALLETENAPVEQKQTEQSTEPTAATEQKAEQTEQASEQTAAAEQKAEQTEPTAATEQASDQEPEPNDKIVYPAGKTIPLSSIVQTTEDLIPDGYSLGFSAVELPNGAGLLPEVASINTAEYTFLLKDQTEYQFRKGSTLVLFCSKDEVTIPVIWCWQFSDGSYQEFSSSELSWKEGTQKAERMLDLSANKVATVSTKDSADLRVPADLSSVTGKGKAQPLVGFFAGRIKNGESNTGGGWMQPLGADPIYLLNTPSGIEIANSPEMKNSSVNTGNDFALYVVYQSPDSRFIALLKKTAANYASYLWILALAAVFIIIFILLLKRRKKVK